MSESIGGITIRSTKEVITPDTRICSLVYAPPKFGKALEPDSLVLTKSGDWKFISNLKVGEPLAAIDGQPSEVIGVYPQAKQDMYKVHFRDGRYTICSGNHLWTVSSKEWTVDSKVLTTTEIQKLNNLPSYNNRLTIPRPTGEWGENSNITINPWLFGFLLGDGSFRQSSVMFSTADGELVEKVKRKLLLGNINHVSRYDYRIVDGGLLKRELEKLGLWNHLSQDKFVPNNYLKANRATRVALLQGLLDSDGTVEKTGAVNFSSSSEQLALDVQELAWSLGIISTLSVRTPTYSYRGASLEGLEAYRVSIIHENPKQFLSLQRKIDRIGDTYKDPNLTIRDVELIGKDEPICVAVSHPSELFITDKYISTHNTTFAGSLNELTLKHFGKPTIFIALEAGEGGGTMSIQNLDCPFVVPNSLDELDKIIAELTTDTRFGGIVLDSSTELVNRFLKPYALKFPSRENVPTRRAGVPERSDYQTMGEKLRELLNRLINITALPDAKLRKHLMVTATEKEKQDGGVVVAIQPELPGAMAQSATAMFQIVGSVGIREKIDPVTKARTKNRVFITEANGVRVVGDRTKILPPEAPLNWTAIWEQYWIPKLKELGYA